MHGTADEMVHLWMQMAQSQLQEFRPFVWGYVASYDPKRHYVTVIVPNYRDPDTGEAVVSPWMPLGSPWVGNGFGMKFAPFGGATSAKPSAGEACQVSLIERETGVCWGANLMYNDVMQSPLPAIAAGEGLIQHKSGSRIYFRADGSIILQSTANLEVTADGPLEVVINGATTAQFNQTVQANVTGDLDVNVSGNANVQASVSATVSSPVINLVGAAIKLCAALTDTLRGLCTSIFETWAASHTHGGVQTGSGTSGPPSTPPPAGSLTSVVTAE